MSILFILYATSIISGVDAASTWFHHGFIAAGPALNDAFIYGVVALLWGDLRKRGGGW